MDNELSGKYPQQIPPVPPATEIDCIETNKVFDECLLRKCIYPVTVHDVNMAADCIMDVECSNFRMSITAPIVPVRRNTDPPGFVRISFHFTAHFNLTVTGRNCATQVESVTLPTQTVSNVMLYCPEPLAQILTQQGTSSAPSTIHNQTIKLEFVGECIDVDFAANPEHSSHTDFTLAVGYYLVIKCEQVVQIQVLSRGYCIAPICEDPVTDPCAGFIFRPVPPFFPAQLPFDQ